VDGWALEIILSRYTEAFTELAVLSKTALCCRVTPSQKAQVILYHCLLFSLNKKYSSTLVICMNIVQFIILNNKVQIEICFLIKSKVRFAPLNLSLIF
jgi:hypothetical protein